MNDIVAEDIAWLIQHTPYNMFQNKKILVTGANGSIARYIVFYFMELSKNFQINCAVYALARNEEKAAKVFGNYLSDSHFRIVVGNVEDITNCTGGMDFIFHAAGISATAMFESNPVEVLQANLIGTYRLLAEIAGNGNQKISRFVFFSSGAVYGDAPNDSVSLDETTYYPFQALSNKGVYAEGKRAGELLCYAYWKQYHLPVAMARIGHTYGPGIDLSDGHVYSDFIKAIIDKEDILLRNPIDKRPFTYVRDTVYGLLILALYAENGNAYNIWNVDGWVSIGELADMLTRNVFKERDIKVYYDGERYEYREKTAGKNVRRGDTDKIEKLGWKAFVTIQEGFYRSVRSFEDAILTSK